MKEISFMSEHTAEYALVPDLIAKLADRFPRVVPTYYWGTREGSRVGRESFDGRAVRVAAAFARRPKVTHPGCDSILMKVNDVLFATAHAGSEVGVPVFAGVPLVNNLVDFSVGVRCAWFHVTSTSDWSDDREFRLSLTCELLVPEPPEGVAGPLNQTQLLQIVESQCEQVDWMFALNAMRYVKSAGGMQHPIFGGGYRPFFLLMVADQGDTSTTQSRLPSGPRRARPFGA